MNFNRHSRSDRRVAASLCGIVLLIAPIVAAAAANTGALRCKEILVFVSASCPHCAAAREFLSELKNFEPRLEIRYREVSHDAAAREELRALLTRHDIDRAGVPTFDICGHVFVGFNADTVMASLYSADPAPEPGVVNVPLLGEISLTALGLPAFTIAIGLVDGFNPCAMWVLLFLLSILVNVKRRSRIALVAGTFVLISGLIYFAFMAAWLNAFLFVGYSRALQVTLGTLALVVGSVHVKDFFALARGVSLSIPASMKPGLYGRIRRVVRAENLPLALAGTVVLAVLVNFVELLCTAGLPALYTQVLSNQALDRTAYYGYLGLYNLAYIADDSVMVALAIFTLGHRKLQEKQGRWLKLLSGGLIMILGAVLIFAPGKLVF